MTVNVGIIGPKRSAAGYGLGSYIAREVLNNPDATLLALMDTTKDNIRKAISLINSESNIRNIFSGERYLVKHSEDFFKREDIDLVIICSPAATHETYIQSALQNKKHVLVEKPLIQTTKSASLSERIQRASTMLKTAEVNGLFLSTNCQRAAVIPFLKDHFGVTENPSSIKIDLTIGTKTGILMDNEGLFDLLIAHPLSLLVKFGAVDYRLIKVKDYSAQRDFLSINQQLNGYYKDDKKVFNYQMVLRQSLKQSMASMTMMVDDIGPIYITTRIMNNGNTRTQYSYRDNSIATLVAEDILNISITKMITAVKNGGDTMCPLISNSESFEVYAMQEVMRDKIFKQKSGEDLI